MRTCMIIWVFESVTNGWAANCRRARQPVFVLLGCLLLGGYLWVLQTRVFCALRSR